MVYVVLLLCGVCYYYGCVVYVVCCVAENEIEKTEDDNCEKNNDLQLPVIVSLGYHNRGR